MSKKIKYLTLLGSVGLATGVGAQVYLCQQCYPGTYAPAGSTKCTNCPAGKYAKYSGQSSCDTCSAGTYATGGAKECTQCRAGTYQSSSGQSNCISCPAGTYSDAVGATSSSVCKKCPAGTYSNVGSSSCTPCPDYKWSSEGSPYCKYIYFKTWYYHRNPYSTQYRWLPANNTTHSCSNEYMGFDPNKGEKKYCSFRHTYGTGNHDNYEILYLTKEGRTFSFDCKSLPCTIYKDKETYYVGHSDKSLEICNYMCIEEEDDDGWLLCTNEYEWNCDTYPNQVDWW